MSRFTRNTPPPAPPKELHQEPVVFDPIPKEERRPQPINLDAGPVYKIELAIASIVSHLFKTKPRIFKIICMHCDVDFLDVYEWAREKLRCT